jgi:hypothetical protein
MRTPTLHIALIASSRAQTTSRRPRCVDPASHREDSPLSPYLRGWLAHQATQHRNLLLNIDAAARIGLAPVVVGR